MKILLVSFVLQSISATFVTFLDNNINNAGNFSLILC